MPEMPEVEIIRRSLDEYLRGQTIVRTEILLSRQIKWPDKDEFCALAIEQRISGVERVGKYLIIKLENGAELVFHLRMTGRLLYVPAGADTGGHVRLIFHLAGGASLVYGDTRTLGVIYGLRPGERWRISALNEMGAEPLSEGFTPEYLREITAKRRMKIKPLLLNQKLIGGIGNIYADEALFLAKINPERSAMTLSDEEIKRLFQAVNQVISDGITDGGTTFRDYKNADGEKGSHQEKLAVYNRAGEPCPLCGTPIEKKTVGGRGSHFCPKCQPEVTL